MIALGRGRRCAAHRAALLDFAARRAGGPAVGRALDHLERCRDCESELATTTLIVHALRRLHDETWRAEPAPDSWARLRTRLAATRRQPSRVLSGLPGAALAFGLCAALVGPSAIHGGRSGIVAEAPRSAPPPYLVFERSRERAREVGLLPEPRLLPQYTGRRVAPPPIAADLPPSMAGRIEWIDDAAPRAATAESPDESGVAQRRTDRR